MRGGVLVVDDSAEVRALAVEILAGEGIEATVATTGEEAIAAFASAPPACILLDVRLPGLDGIAVCERIRGMPGGKQVAILFVTAKRDVEVFDRALRAGGDDFLTKPFRPGELVVRIETARRLRELTSERGALSRELKRQRDELQRLHLQREQLTEFLVHDLKNPAHAIELLARRIMRGVASEPRTHEFAQMIREESRSLLHMITNLLDLNRSQEGDLALTRTAVEIRALVAAAINDLQARASAANLKVVAEVGVDTVELDRDLIQRVLANLLENALRHAPEGTTVTITARDDTGAFQLRVADSGPGVPPELREVVFQRFASTAPRTNHGLGLAFCRVAVAAHGGRIWVEDGQPGAVFCVELPGAR